MAAASMGLTMLGILIYKLLNLLFNLATLSSFLF
jgi:hypothetical protein